MPRWPYVHILYRSCTDFRASRRTEPQLVKLMLPHAVFCARPHLIITPSDSRSCIRATGMLCEMATLKRTENCHQERATDSSPSTSSRLGITSRCAIPKAYGCQLGRLVIHRTHLNWTRPHCAHLRRPGCRPGWPVLAENRPTDQRSVSELAHPRVRKQHGS